MDNFKKDKIEPTLRFAAVPKQGRKPLLVRFHRRTCLGAQHGQDVVADIGDIVDCNELEDGGVLRGVITTSEGFALAACLQSNKAELVHPGDEQRIRPQIRRGRS